LTSCRQERVSQIIGKRRFPKGKDQKKGAQRHWAAGGGVGRPPSKKRKGNKKSGERNRFKKRAKTIEAAAVAKRKKLPASGITEKKKGRPRRDWDPAKRDKGGEPKKKREKKKERHNGGNTLKEGKEETVLRTQKQLMKKGRVTERGEGAKMPDREK